MTDIDKLNAADAIRTLCALTKTINMLTSIGLNVEGSDTDGIGHSIYLAIDKTLNVLARVFKKLPGDEKFEEVVRQFIENNPEDKGMTNHMLITAFTKACEENL